MVVNGEGRLTAPDTPPEDERNLSQWMKKSLCCRLLYSLVLSRVGERGKWKLRESCGNRRCFPPLCLLLLVCTLSDCQDYPSRSAAQLAAALSPRGGHCCVKLQVTRKAETKLVADFKVKAQTVSEDERFATFRTRGDIYLYFIVLCIHVTCFVNISRVVLFTNRQP